MHDYIFNVSLFLAGALAVVTAIGYHTETRADRRRRDRETPSPELAPSTGRFVTWR